MWNNYTGTSPLFTLGYSYPLYPSGKKEVLPSSSVVMLHQAFCNLLQRKDLYKDDILSVQIEGCLQRYYMGQREGHPDKTGYQAKITFKRPDRCEGGPQSMEITGFFECDILQPDPDEFADFMSGLITEAAKNQVRHLASDTRVWEEFLE